MKISYQNIGCKVNFSEIAEIQKIFENKGYETVKFGEKADAVIINTCSVTNTADSDCRKIIRRAIKSSPDAFIGVIGCYAQLKPDEISSIEGVDAIFGIKEKFDIVDYLVNFKSKDKAKLFVSNTDDLPFHTACSVDNESHTRLVLKIQDGCDYTCSYCTIPKARGKSRSMDYDKLKNKIIELSNSDYHEIVLSGVNLGEYQAQTGERFLEVVKFIEESGIKQRIRISSIEPNMLKPEIIEIIKNSKTFCPHFHIPLQSGSPEILASMKRRYNVKYFEDLILRIKKDIPHSCIGIDVISGFPGETEKHFNETYQLLEKLPVSYLHCFTYSERDSTPAASFNEIVPHTIRKDRTKALRQLSDIKKNEFYQSQIGEIRIVIPEDITLESDNNYQYYVGWTENYVRVKFPSNILNQNEPTKVKIIKSFGDVMLGGTVEQVNS